MKYDLNKLRMNKASCFKKLEILRSESINIKDNLKNLLDKIDSLYMNNERKEEGDRIFDYICEQIINLIQCSLFLIEKNREFENFNNFVKPIIQKYYVNGNIYYSAQCLFASIIEYIIQILLIKDDYTSRINDYRNFINENYVKNKKIYRNKKNGLFSRKKQICYNWYEIYKYNHISDLYKNINDKSLKKECKELTNLYKETCKYKHFNFSIVFEINMFLPSSYLESDLILKITKCFCFLYKVIYNDLFNISKDYCEDNFKELVKTYDKMFDTYQTALKCFNAIQKKELIKEFISVKEKYKKELIEECKSAKTKLKRSTGKQNDRLFTTKC